MTSLVATRTGCEGRHEDRGVISLTEQTRNPGVVSQIVSSTTSVFRVLSNDPSRVCDPWQMDEKGSEEPVRRRPVRSWRLTLFRSAFPLVVRVGTGHGSYPGRASDRREAVRRGTPLNAWHGAEFPGDPSRLFVSGRIWSTRVDSWSLVLVQGSRGTPDGEEKIQTETKT